MKIVHVIGAFNVGGAENLVKDLAKKMSNKHEVEVWSISLPIDIKYQEEYIRDLETYGIKIRTFNKRDRKDKLSTIKKIYKAIKDSKPDIINSHLEGVSFYVMISNLFLKTKILQTIHNTKIDYPLLQKYLAKNLICKFIAISEETKKVLEIECGIPEEKIKIIFNGVDIHKFNIKDRYIAKNVGRIISISRLEEQKDHKSLLFAYKDVIDCLSNKENNIPKLCIVGDGKLKQNLIDISRDLGIEKYIEFWGQKENISDILKESDIYIMTSIYEGLSISLIEASISGIPIIATDVGSNYEIIKHDFNGILVEPRNISKIRNSLIDMITNYELRNRISKNNYINKIKFDINQTVELYEKVYIEQCKVVKE